MNDKTAIFIDVDGVINDLRWEHWPGTPNRFMAGKYQISIPEHVPGLIKYLVRNFDCYWLTTWRERANLWISPALDIPGLPVITDGTTDRHVEWKAAEAQKMVNRLRYEKGIEKVYWIEDFYGRLPQIEGVTPIDTGNYTVLTPQHLPDEITPPIWRGRRITPHGWGWEETA